MNESEPFMFKLYLAKNVDTDAIVAPCRIASPWLPQMAKNVDTDEIVAPCGIASPWLPQKLQSDERHHCLWKN